MKKERTIHELIKVMLDNQYYFSTGLCGWCLNLLIVNQISEEEFVILKKYIKNNKPFNLFQLKYFFKHKSESSFYWKPDDINPRIKWLNKHIKKTAS